MKFTSQYFKTADDLVQAKNEAYQGVESRRERLKIIRQFTNMMNTLTAEEAEELGRTEITNHGMTYKAMQQNETIFSSMVTGTNALAEIIVDTGNPEQDLVTGQWMSLAVNRGAINRRGKFHNFWRKVSGELVIAGGCPVTQSEKYGWLPAIRTDMFFPPETDLDAEAVTYAFDPKELSMSDLQHLRQCARDEGYISKQNIDELIETLKRQIKDKSTAAKTVMGEEISRSVRDSGTIFDQNISIPAYWYYEVKYDDKGDQYVSSTLFVDGNTAGSTKIDSNNREQGSVAKIIAHVEKLSGEVTDWLHLINVDSEIGGVKNLDTLRGVAELNYPSGVDMEELLNLIIEGEKIRARPKIRVGPDADPDEVAKWNLMTDLYAPSGVEEMPFRSSPSGLNDPLQILNQNSAGITTSSVSNSPRGGELRQQAVERQQQSTALQTNRTVEAYNHLDSILETIVWRLFNAPVKPGTEGYHEIMWVRAFLDKREIPYRQLSTRKHGQFEFIRVRARRTIGNGDRVQQVSSSDWLMQNLRHYEPAARARIIHLATTLQTQDPDLADSVVKIPQAIVNAQKITAENEYDTIKRRAVLGEVFPVSMDDVHQDHIPVHLKDMLAHANSHGIRPWDKLDVLAFGGMAEHVGEHIRIIMSNPDFADEAIPFIRDYQNIVQSAQAIVEEVSAQEEQRQGAGLTPKEQAEMQLKMGKLELEARKLGMKYTENDRLENQRRERTELQRRKQYVSEVEQDRRLKLEEERLRKDTQGDRE
jgi:hypothetical protein